MAADGSIIIDTRIDTDGISSGVKEVQAAFKDLANSVKEINANINSVFHDGFEKLEDSFQSLQQKSEKVENSMDKMGNSAKKTGATVSNSFNKMDISGASRKVNLLGRQFEGLGTIVKRIGFWVGSAFAVGKLIQFGKEGGQIYGNVSSPRGRDGIRDSRVGDGDGLYVERRGHGQELFSAGQALSAILRRQHHGKLREILRVSGGTPRNAHVPARPQLRYIRLHGPRPRVCGERGRFLFCGAVQGNVQQNA